MDRSAAARPVSHRCGTRSEHGNLCHLWRQFPVRITDTVREGNRREEAMDPATLAVVGTLSGVVITAVAALLGNLLAARHQRATTERQLLHAVSERLRTERRTTFVDYLSTYSDLREKINASTGSRPDETAAALPHPAQGASGRRRASRVDEYAAEEAARFSRAYHTLRITGNNAVGEAAHRCTSDLWVLADLAATGDPGEFEEGWQTAQRSRRDLREAMRAELGVTEPQLRPPGAG